MCPMHSEHRYKEFSQHYITLLNAVSWRMCVKLAGEVGYCDQLIICSYAYLTMHTEHITSLDQYHFMLVVDRGKQSAFSVIDYALVKKTQHVFTITACRSHEIGSFHCCSISSISIPMSVRSPPPPASVGPYSYCCDDDSLID